MMKLIHRLLGQAPRPSMPESERTEADNLHDSALKQAHQRINEREREIQMLRRELHDELGLSDLEDRLDDRN
jgi:hypothetical protein